MRRLYLIKEIKEMLLWPFFLCFRTHFIHNNPHFLQRLCMQALHMLNSDNLERSFLKLNPTQGFLSFPFSESSCRLAPHKAHEQLPPSWNTEQNSPSWEQSWVKTVFLERCIKCIRYIWRASVPTGKPSPVQTHGAFTPDQFIINTLQHCKPAFHYFTFALLDFKWDKTLR